VGGFPPRHHILCATALVCAFSGVARATFSRASDASDGPTWVHHKPWNVWIRRPADWRRHKAALAGNVIFRYIDPAGKAAFEAHALHLPSQDADIEALADALEASMRVDAGYFRERLASAKVTVAGGQALARRYRGPVGGMMARAEVRYVRRKDAVFVVLCAYPESLSNLYEQLAKDCVKGFRLRPPASSGSGKRSSPATRLAATILKSAFGEWVYNDDFNFWAYRPPSWRDQKNDLPRNGVRRFNDPSGNAGLVIYAAELPPGEFTVEEIADASEGYFAARTPLLDQRLSSRQHPLHGASGILRRYRGSADGVGTRATVLYVLQDNTLFVVFGFCAEPFAPQYGDALTESVTSFHFASPDSK